MGISYPDLDYLLKLRKKNKYGFKSLAISFIEHNKGKRSQEKCIQIVKKFYSSFCANRHKVCTLPPGIHLTKYSAENDRFDRRPLFYPPDLKFEEKMLRDYLQRDD
jgi:NAD+ synthase (glutamine-hydrolysing)